MANALKGKSTVFLIFIAPNEDAAEAVRGFFENHYEFMREKSHREKSQGGTLETSSVFSF